MAYCVKCGAKVEDYVHFCPQCGAEIPQVDNSRGYTEKDTYSSAPYSEASCNGKRDGYFEASEVRSNKAMGVLSYLGILMLIPLLAGNKGSDYVKHHINQGLVLFVLSSVIDLLNGRWVWGFYSWIHFGTGWLSWLFDIADFACLILLIMGIVSACKGTRQELPIIGKIRFFK